MRLLRTRVLGLGLVVASLPLAAVAGYGSGGRLADEFPAQARARQISGEPATFRWALLIGINDYAGNVPDNVGSRQDAEVLRSTLLKWGWRSDHILLLRDRAATAGRIVEAIRWLSSKTTSRSTVVFHYAGHERPHTTPADGDREARDVALWASDNRDVVDGIVGRELDRVRSAAMWVHFATCRAGGFDDRGIAKRGRVVTYSSPEHQYSYEDPSLGHSLIGYHMIAQGMRRARADRNRSGTVGVQEAFVYARPLVLDHSSRRQGPFMVDLYGRPLSLVVPPKPRPRRSSARPPQDCALYPVCVV